MATNNIITILLLSLLPMTGMAQKHNKQKHKKHLPAAATAAPGTEHKPMKTFKDPEWAPVGYHSEKHIYFPDYYTFYDPHRGYITWEKDTWVARPTMPLFLENKDIRKERVQILEDISLDLYPEQNYPRYMKMYPASPGAPDMMIPVPNSTGRPGGQ
jgi:hypothetical protein